MSGTTIVKVARKNAASAFERNFFNSRYDWQSKYCVMKGINVVQIYKYIHGRNTIFCS